MVSSAFRLKLLAYSKEQEGFLCLNSFLNKLMMNKELRESVLKQFAIFGGRSVTNSEAIKRELRSLKENFKDEILILSSVKDDFMYLLYDYNCIQSMKASQVKKFLLNTFCDKETLPRFYALFCLLNKFLIQEWTSTLVTDVEALHLTSKVLPTTNASRSKFKKLLFSYMVQLDMTNWQAYNDEFVKDQHENDRSQVFSILASLFQNHSLRPEMGVIESINDIVSNGSSIIVDKLSDLGLKVVQDMFVKVGGALKDQYEKNKQVLGIMSAVVFSLYLQRMLQIKGRIDMSLKAQIVFAFILGLSSQCWNIDFVTKAMSFKREKVNPEIDSADVITTLLTAYFVSSKEREEIFSPDIIKKISSIGMSKKGLNDVLDSLFEVFKTIAELISRSAGVPFRFSTGDSAVDKYFRDYDAIMLEHSAGTFAMTTYNFQKISDLANDGQSLIRSSSIKNGSLYNYIVSCNRQVLKVRDAFRLNNISATGLRFETIGIVLVGPPGTAKSHLNKKTANHLVIADCKSQEERDNHIQNDSTYIFNWQPENKYLDGYKNITKVVTWDDVFQFKNVAGGNPETSEALMLIRMLNIFPMAMHMADINMKGNMSFNAIALCMTTNLKIIKPEDIISPGAVIRRLTSYFVTVKEKYRVDTKQSDLWSVRLDPLKLPINEDGLTYIPGEIYEIYKYDIANGKIDYNSKMDFDTYMENIRLEYIKRYKHFEANQISFKKEDLNYYSKLSENGHFDKVHSIHDNIRDNNISLNIGMPGSWIRPEMDLGEIQMSSYDALNSDSDSETNSIDVNKLQTKDDLINEIEGFSDFSKIAMRLSYVSQNYFRLTSDSSWVLTSKDKNEVYSRLWHLLNSDKDLFICIVNINDFLPELVPSQPYPIVLREKADAFWKRTSEQFIKTIKDPMLEGIYSCASFGYKFVKENPLTTVFGVIGTVYTISKLLFADEDEEFESQSLDSKTALMKKSKERRTVRSLKEFTSVPQILDMQGAQVAKSVLNSNVVTFCTEDGEDKKIFGHITFIKGRIALLQLHYMMHFMAKMHDNPDFGNTVLSIVRQNSEVYKLTVFDFVDMFKSDDQILPDVDLIFVEFPREMPLFSDISSKFIPKAKIESLPTIFKGLFSVGKRSFNAFCDVKLSLKPKNALEVPVGTSWQYELERYVEYDIPTEVGDCGTPLFVMLPSLGSTRILGTHSAGSSRVDKGFAGVVSHEEVLEKLSLFNKVVLARDSSNKVIPDSIDVVPQIYENVILETKVLKKHVQGGSHSHIESPLRNSSQFQSTKELSIVSSNNDLGVNPISDNFLKFKGNVRDLLDYNQSQCRTKALESLKTLILAIPPVSKVARKSLEECIWGEDGNDSVNAINTNSSPGYVHKIECPNLKKNLLGEGSIRDASNPSFAIIKKRVYSILENCNKGIVPFVPFTANLKYEKLPKGKLTRMYYGSDLDLNLSMGIVFGVFREAYLKSSISSEHSLGINACSLEWDSLLKELSKFSSIDNLEVADGDYSAFDRSHDPSDLWSLFDIIELWYDTYFPNNVDFNIRKTLFECVVHCPIVLRDSVFFMVRGQPSGWYMTTVINNLTNKLNYRYCFYRALQENGMCLNREFRDYVSLNVHGDDSLFSVREDFKEYFNMLKVPIYMSELGFKITPALKDNDIEKPFLPLKDVQYLKRSFRYEPFLGYYIGPLTMETVNETLQWTSRKSPEQTFIDNINASLREVALHGRNQYEDFVQKVRLALVECCPRTIIERVNLPSWTSMMEEIFF